MNRDFYEEEKKNDLQAIEKKDKELSELGGLILEILKKSDSIENIEKELSEDNLRVYKMFLQSNKEKEKEKEKLTSDEVVLDKDEEINVNKTIKSNIQTSNEK